MQRVMGPDAYMAMVNRMRAVIGNEQADVMLAACEKMMAAQGAGSGSGMMTAVGQMMGAH